MNREILFRGKCVKSNDWHEGDLIQGNSVNCYENTAGKSFIVGWYLGSVEMIEVDIKTVGQFIGLRDKNKKRIFHGDIINPKYHWSKPHVVSFPDDIYDFEEYFMRKDFVDVEVIGNVYENPELLKE